MTTIGSGIDGVQLAEITSHNNVVPKPRSAMPIEPAFPRPVRHDRRGKAIGGECRPALTFGILDSDG